MHIRTVIRSLGQVLIVLSLALLCAALWSLFDLVRGEETELPAVRALTLSMILGCIMGMICWVFGKGRGKDHLGRREALLLVSLSWLVGSMLAALPYFIWAEMSSATDHRMTSFIACIFEAMSGLTTTGATVLSEIENPLTGGLPRGLLLWRALTHWLGGLGIVVLFVAVLPNLGVGGKKLFAFESPGPQTQGVRPRIRETARVLWLIYLGLTVVQVLLLRSTGLPWFESVCHTFATLATGGFSTYNASTGGPEFTIPALLILIVFMVLAGVNFGMYYELIRGRWRMVYRNPELRLYLLLLVIATVVVTFSIYGKSITLTYFASDGQRVTTEGNFASSLLHGAFQVTSIQTTTGFATADSEQWPFLAQFVLVLVMFIGASAGSTGGGVKVIRLLIAGKVILAELERVYRPNVVRTLKVGGQTVPPELRMGAISYILIIIFLWLIGALALMLIESHNLIDFTTAATASAATLNNIGPGFNAVGAVENYGWFSDASLVVMIFLMALGRLEVFALAVLVMPHFWRSD